MRIKSNLGLFCLAIAIILTVTIQNSCIEEIPQEIEKQQQDNRSDQDSIVPPTPQDSIVPPTPQDSIVQTPLPDSTMTIAAFLEAYTAIDISDFTYILKHSDMWDALSQDSGFTCFVPTNDAIRYIMNPDSLEASQNNTSVETLPDSICTIIARRHLVRDIIQLSSLKEDDGDFNWNNLLGEPIPPLTMLYDTVQYDSDQLNVRARYLFGSSIVIMLDMPVANGMLQFLDRAFPDPTD